MYSRSTFMARWVWRSLCESYGRTETYMPYSSAKRFVPASEKRASSRTDASSLDNANVEDLLKNATTNYKQEASDLRNQAKKCARPKINPRDTTVVLFPGQGSQFVGMGGKTLKLPSAKRLFEEASEILGYDLLELCLNGPKEDLDRTKYCQPAVFVSSLAAVEQLRSENPSAISKCVATAGFSVGEITSLVFAGAIQFEQGVQLVEARAEAMQAACDTVPSGMMTVLYGPDSQLGHACVRAKEWCLQRGIESPECRIANYLFPHCKVVAGHTEALKYIQANSAHFKLKHTKYLPVSGAFHTDVMKPAVEPFKKLLKEIDISMPGIAVHSNVDGKTYRDPRHILQQLPMQMYKPVKWEQTLHIVYERSQGEKFPDTYECGPGTSLKSVLKMVNEKAWNHCVSVQI